MIKDLMEIVETLRRETDLPPRKLIEFHSWCVGEYAYLAAKLEEALATKPTAWILLREDSKSAAEAERKWKATPVGMEEGRLRRQMRVLERILSSLRMRLEVKNQEARNVI